MDPRLRRGVAAFNAGDFFGAHEIWEDLWNDSVGADKLLLQGLVQIAAGYAKVESDVRGGALKLLTRGAALIRPFAPAAMDLDLAALIAAVSADLQRLGTAPNGAVGLETVKPPTLRPAP